MKRKTILSILVATFFCLALVGCNMTSEAQEKRLQIKIAEQYGLAYAPLQIMKEKQLLEKSVPGIEVSWRQLGNTAAIREAMLAGELDIGFMAIPPFLIGWDKGMDWKIACGLSSSPIGLVVNKDTIQSIRDFTKEDRIALPQPGSIQHILLSMACEKEWGDPKRLDNQLITLDHPDGMSALLARSEVSAHFTTPPYLFKELDEPGIHQILDGQAVMGEEFTFAVGVTTGKFYKEQPEVYEAFLKALEEALNFMEDNPTETVSILARAYQMDREELLNYLERSDTTFSIEVQGVMKFADFMQKYSYINRKPTHLEEVLWDRQ
ncbi:ABC-type nitrate/sulfonate/bicarbonate transport system, periplasmic component [Desulfitobacterium dehalogenans ATCC 51507]|uniref:ABC-type nitrate/sulfonate/bicarbonate transport system, periplasmic component n=1 Tax=Desulfitobacterium dehalogenans (strain ATCC 51507 / DSM 9161 / JW/IU-DC1) TaxID=756499 RepID=I4A417_DESDJ|nr:ABC transporter substrate-binding protein [Desulfitobacterium dehalogenans]AFL98701.1 ABC-type nitrate/sulfonate/bicarbonate transport system, periplasmic component [Desulfitobacterium dehalogenans ATCC 51507]